MGAVVFRHNRIKNEWRRFNLASPLVTFLNGIRVENLRFSSKKLKFFILLPFPRSAYIYTPLARQPTISALNPFAPRSVLTKNSPKR